MNRPTHVATILLVAPLLTALLALGACVGMPAPPPLDAVMSSDASAQDAPPDRTGPRTFTIRVVDDDLVVSRGERVTLEVEVRRTGGFDDPVLVELAGLPDGLITLARESRPGDEATRLVIRTDPDGEPIPRSAFVVQATTLEGLRQTAPAHVTVE